MKRETSDVMSKQLDRKEIYEALHHQIADTYLKSAAVKDTPAKPEKRRLHILPWAVAAAALSACLAIFFSKSHIEISVRILGEVPSVRSANSEERFYNVIDKGVYLIKGSESNHLMVRDAYFMGDAGTYSKAAGDQLVLCNSKGAGWANYSIELSEPVNLNKLDLKFIARGEAGGEVLSVVVVDNDNRSYRLEKARSIRLTKEWQAYSINFKPVKNAIDLKNVSVVRFEFGSLTAGNGPVVTIYLKDIYASKTKGIKWL